MPQKHLDYMIPFTTESLENRVKEFFMHFHREDLLLHTMEVVENARTLSTRFGLSEDISVRAALLHDIGHVTGFEDRIQLCKEVGHAFYQEELSFPESLHQNASFILARLIFHETDPEVLSAISCHTTLKPAPSPIDKLLFLSDKMSWKESEHEDLVFQLKKRVSFSMENALRYYLTDLNEKSPQLSYYHPLSKKAYLYFHEVTFRPLEIGDAPLLAKWLSDPTVLEYYEGRDNAFDLDKVLQTFYKDKGTTRWLALKNQEPIGYLQTYPLDEEEREEYGYSEADGALYGMDQFIGETSLWGTGVGTQLVTAARDFLLWEHQADRILMDPQSWNQRSIRCYEKCGFQKKKLLPAHELHEGEYRDCWLMEYSRFTVKK